MKEVLIPKKGIYLSDTIWNTPIFAKKDDKLVGLLIKDKNGWIVRKVDIGVSGYCELREEALSEAMSRGYSFFVED